VGTWEVKEYGVRQFAVYHDGKAMLYGGCRERLERYMAAIALLYQCRIGEPQTMVEDTEQQEAAENAKEKAQG